MAGWSSPEGGETVSEEVGSFHNDRFVEGRLSLPRQGLEFEGKLFAGQPQGRAG